MSAMGDVALTTPVLKGIREQYPDIEVLLLTRPVFKPFFSSINGLGLFSPDLGDRHAGLSGLMRLYRDIKRQGTIDHVIDLHDVLRSKLLRLFFRLSGVPVSVINKGRSEKKGIIRGISRIRLKHSVERYCDVFARAGFTVQPGDGPWIIPSPDALVKVNEKITASDELNIGVAPYAKHKLKMWPEENMIRLLEMISEKHRSRIWLFGGVEESEKLTAFKEKVPGTCKINDGLTLGEELALMSKLDLMIAMDSSNMHMAALVGAKVISIWGGTDPIIGFGAWKQPEEHFVSIPLDILACRPCTIYGKGECRRGDLACMNWLTPEMVLEKIEKILSFSTFNEHN
jgi:ADP-heptose:LPS heptosyltransferase